MAYPAAAGDDQRSGNACLSTWEQAIADRAAEADSARTMCLASANTHVYAIAEVIRARVAERGGDLHAEVTGAVEALKRDVVALLDRMADVGGAA